MKEYTLLAAASIFLAVVLNRITKAKLFGKVEFYLFLFIIFGFKLLVNGYLTGADIVQYDPRFFLGVRIGSIPVEDFFFGFSMVSLTIIFWEYFKAENK
jgi:lycopene cyclase domain-containing protein